MNDYHDTIVAISTPRGYGGLAIVRSSGDHAIEIADQVFRSKKRLSETDAQQALVGQIIDIKNSGKVNQNETTSTNFIVDEVVTTIFRKPHSYTGEDLVEITCHGGFYVSDHILQLMLRHGARLAEPGEFTRRAFINGRIDLLQAEAVADLIAAKTKQSHRTSVQLLTGTVSKKLNKLRDQLIEICSLLELELDFSDEDVKFIERDQVLRKINQIKRQIDSLITSYRYGKIIREGVRIAIVGRPNVGKSSLLNAMLQDDRAITTDIPGTTRDVLTEDLDINGYLCHVTDTAGFQIPKNAIESEGIKRSEKAVNEADVVLYVMDGSTPLNKKDLDTFLKTKAILDKTRFQRKIIIVQNKIDLSQYHQSDDIKKKLDYCEVIRVSAKTYAGIKNLLAFIVEQIKALKETSYNGDITITQTRHRDALIRARQSLIKAKDSSRRGLSGEFVTLDLRASLDAFSDLVGKVTTVDILNNIFSNFCIGK